ncbi:superoxide dismutase family protein [Alteraurantiacibacter aestuarii]|uniref:Superoxide dismutase family protein n=1 Tax=Alteraurantiacibacter aestuarii TaxID=650004 RepID=A0A844ZJP5_9SPHN|nr:superoxide dismutase family protein [Alteraurantiacibacter aestuarii]MXO87127.1 superoxide dismutase family protein [Alteraurantiacibacter aestuarii]
MKLAVTAITIALLPLLTACQTVTELPSELVASAQLRHANGNPAGSAMLYRTGGDMTLTVALTGFDQGIHAVHLHQTGNCEASDFTSAGGHLNPLGKAHGSLNPGGSHLGDLPNAMIGANGLGTISSTLRGDATQVSAWLFDDDGTAIVVHAGLDDYRTDPAGAAGGRIACGVLTPS